MDSAAILHLIIRAATFGLVLSLWMAGMVVWLRFRANRRRRMARRLGLTGAGGEAVRVLRLWHDGQESTTTVPDEESAAGWRDRLDQFRRDAGWNVPLRTLCAGAMAFVLLVSALVYMLTNAVVPAALAAGAVMTILWTYATHRIDQRAALFDRQLVDALSLASRSLRAGHPVLSAFRVVADELAAPVGPVFADICQQQELGIGQEDAIRNAAGKCRSTDMALLATSVVIQLRSGGNLADMMDRVAHVIRDRLRLNRRVRVLTAQTQLSKRVLMALPFVVFFVLHVISPEYMQPLYTESAGRVILAAAGTSLLLGWWLMRRISVLTY